MFENFRFRGKHKPIDLSPSDPKLHNKSVREISFKYYRLSTRQIIHLHMHCLGLQVSVNTVSKILKKKTRLPTVPFVSTYNSHANQQTTCRLQSLRSHVRSFFKICTLPNSKNIGVVQTLRNRFRPSTRIFYPIKRAKFSHPHLLKVTLIVIFKIVHAF